MSDAQKWKEKFVAAQEIMKDAIPEHNAQLQDSSKLAPHHQISTI